MTDNQTSENHFNEWIGNSDVNEEIDVYENYINYENYCPFVWEDYQKFEYKVEGNKLMIKCFDFEHVGYAHVREENKGRLYKFIKDGKINEKELTRYFNDTEHDTKYENKYRNDVLKIMNWFEFQPRGRHFRYTKPAKDWIIKQIKNKNFKH